MIRIEFTADSGQQAREMMRDLLGMDRETVAPETTAPRTTGQPAPLPATADPVPAKATRTKKSAAGKDESASSAEPTPSPEPEAQGQPATDTGTAPATAGSSSTDVTPEALRAKASEYGMKNEPGLKELLVQFGTNGKFSGVPVENYGPMMVRLEELLAGAEG